MSPAAAPVPGSFRDPSSRVYESRGDILRGVNEAALANFLLLREQPFYRQLEESGAVARTTLSDESAAEDIKRYGWQGALRHERVVCISYPYEWTFSMLQDAALLQLDILERSLKAGWTLKDATPFNIQFVGPKPVFIDIPSFIPRQAGEYWVGYRQFCMLYLYPLMLRAHLGVDFNGHLRADLDGIPPIEFARYFAGLRRLKRGVLAHVLFPAAMEQAVERRERNGVPAQQRPQLRQSDAMVIGLVQSLRRLVGALHSPLGHTDWSDYETTHSYGSSEYQEKRDFVARAVASQRWNITWDLGANTGDFSRICAQHSDFVLAVDGDHDAAEKLYLGERGRPGSNILPLVMNLANVSPNQGWAGAERDAFDARNPPELIVCLALVHHMALAANIPIPMFLDWLRSLRASLIIEFVDRHDEMVEKLLAYKTETYPGYTLKTFDAELRRRFRVIDEKPLKDGKRRIYFCEALG